MRNIETFPSKQMWQECREENQERRHFCQNCHILFWSEDLDVNIKCQKFQKRRCCISWSAKSENVAICRRISNLKNFVCFMSIFNEKQKSMYMLAFFFCCSLSHPIFPCPPFSIDSPLLPCLPSSPPWFSRLLSSYPWLCCPPTSQPLETTISSHCLLSSTGQPVSFKEALLQLKLEFLWYGITWLIIIDRFAIWWLMWTWTGSNVALLRAT